MIVRRHVSLALAAVLFSQAAAAGLDIDIVDSDIRRASDIAMSSEAARARFHDAYNVPVHDPAIERIEVITEFRRFVMEAERQNALGNWMMARGGYDSKGRTLKDLVKASRGQVAIRVSIRLHPLHIYSSMPPYDIALGDLSLLPVSVSRTPIMRAPEDGGALAGAIIETAFNGPSIGDATLPVRITLDGKEIVRVAVDFSKLD